MAQPKFTPGPWTLSDDAVRRIIKGAGAKPRTVCIIESWTTEPDARLIAAAPDLYAVVRELSDLCPRMSDDDPIGPAIRDAIMRGRAALAKAEGRDAL